MFPDLKTVPADTSGRIEAAAVDSHKVGGFYLSTSTGSSGILGFGSMIPVDSWALSVDSRRSRSSSSYSSSNSRNDNNFNRSHDSFSRRNDIFSRRNGSNNERLSKWVKAHKDG
ncbi:hypothetical protein Taro_002241 [Colocasia esculenta]|uniref:Uncharacterized protein n=1 Tax=Colocasia esculenta TaxID=4460 RepID=A0A843TN13_COLES|nr:hypothetical protein [Colocasia esculenta]